MSNIVMGINYVRPPVINITKKNVTKDYTKYEIETKHKSKYKLNENWYEGITGIPPLDNAIKESKEFAYTHHINRLMIISNI